MYNLIEIRSLICFGILILLLQRSEYIPYKDTLKRTSDKPIKSLLVKYNADSTCKSFILIEAFDWITLGHHSSCRHDPSIFVLVIIRILEQIKDLGLIGLLQL